MQQIGLPVRQVHIASVAGLLEDGIRIVIFRLQMIRIMPLIGLRRLAGDDRIHGILFIGTPDIFGAAHGDAVVVARAALRAHDVIVFPPLRQMGRLDAAPIRAPAPDPFHMAHDLLFFGVVFHHADLARLLIAFPGLPLQRYHIFSPIVIVEQGRIEACGIQIHRSAPRSPDILRRDQKIVHVEIPGVHGIHHAVYHIK